MNTTEAAMFLGAPEHEIVDVYDTPAGTCIVTSDGNTVIVVPVDIPDGDGKTGLMFLTAPDVPGGYRGDFPVFVNPPEEEDTMIAPSASADTRDVGVSDLSGMSKDQLIDYATREFGVTMKANWGIPRMLEAIADHQAEKDARS